MIKAIKNKEYSETDKIKLLILYNLRYEQEKGNAIIGIVEDLLKAGYDPFKVRLISKAGAYAGSHQRIGDLFENKNSILVQKFRKTITLKNEYVESIFLQHKPLVDKILKAVVASQLSELDFPFVAKNKPSSSHRMIVVFIAGGITYEEERFVHLFNQSNPKIKVFLGGTCFHNSTSFLEEIDKMN